jgi:phenylacetate-CoA ligase
MLGLEELYDIPGLTELYGPGTGLDCHKHEGIHYWADYYILEILDPVTLEPVEPGQVGEMVVTTLCKEAAPLIRYRTRDLTRLIPHPCSCGNILPMHDRILGRSDDMIILRGVNLYPGHIDEILSKMDGVGSEYQIHLFSKEDGKDYMTLKVERGGEALPADDSRWIKKIKDAIKKQILVSCEVEIVDYRSLPRSERKSKRVFDVRG